MMFMWRWQLVCRLYTAAFILYTCDGFSLQSSIPALRHIYLHPQKQHIIATHHHLAHVDIVVPQTYHARIATNHHAIANADTDATDTSSSTSSLQISNASAQLDPLLTSFLLRSIRNDDDTDNIHNVNAHFFTFSDASKAMVGLRIWETSLRKARLPTIDDFDQCTTWPDEPLFSYVFDVLSKLGLPRLVRRHSEVLTTSVLFSVAKIVVQFIKAHRQGKLVVSDDIDEEDGEYSLEEDIIEDDYSTQFEYEPLSTDELDQLADSLSSSLQEQWGGIVQGVTQLDKVFGYDHGLLDQQRGESDFGINNAIWSHNGWAPMPDLQRRILSMPELRELLSKLGRRQSASGTDNRRFRPRKRSYNTDDMMGVQLDPLDPTSVSGLTLSNDLSTMLPTEAVLLRSSMRALRLLFLAKKAESKLLSYELSGWTDVPTKPLPNTKRSVQLPSKSGGPLIICLDTSHSMSGIREDLSKAVVLAAITEAHRQGRECRVVAFSSASNTIESGNISCDANGIRRLLDFLSYSFGGGTDVTGALKHAMEVLENDLASSDILLVSDGELSSPPVSKLMLAKLEGLKQQTGTEVHGLLVGKRESESMNLLCTEVHDFLGDYDDISGVITDIHAGMKTRRSASALSLFPMDSRFLPTRQSFLNRWSTGQRSGRTSLHAMSQPNHEIDASGDLHMKLQKRGGRGAKSKKQRFDDDDDDHWEFEDDDESYTGGGSSKFLSSDTQETPIEKPEYVLRVEEAVKLLEKTAEETLNERKHTLSDMNISPPSSNVISETIAHIESGLVERDLEARLVVLGMISREHILFIGPPGTSKSEIGRRLAQLCGGPFFQRLFTRFTTPEEIFGPLSLRALEADEYRRCTEGFLPTATVAFLDEIFKANSAILNTLLTILNERKFDNGAGNREDCPLKCVIGASNELPDSEELDALLDRFLLRSYVTSVSDEGLMEILNTQSLSNEPDLDSNKSNSLDEVVADISSKLNDVSIDQNISILIRDIRSFLRDQLGIYVSDRRLVKSARLLKVVAISNGRDRVDYIDCLLLQHILWQLPENRDTIREWLLDNMTPSNDVVDQTKFIFQNLANEAFQLVKKTQGDITGESGARSADLEAISSIKTELEEIEQLLLQKLNEITRHIVLLDMNHLWISHDEAKGTKQYLLPLAEEASTAVKETLFETIMLNLALSSRSIDNEIRSDVIEALASSNDSDDGSKTFTDDELQISLKQAKRQYKGDLLRQWKSERANME